MFAYDYRYVKIGEIFNRRSGLGEVLRKVLGRDEQKIKALILSRMICHLPQKRMGSLNERFYLSGNNLKLNSPRIS